MSGAADGLDNAVWHALTGTHAPFAQPGPRARAVRYDPTVATFAALPDHPDAEAWNDLAELVGDGGGAVLFRPGIELAPGWRVDGSWPSHQHVYGDPHVPDPLALTPGPGRWSVTELGPDDVDEMLDLVARTEPGPFARRTVELGRYVGIRCGGDLVAMAGQRMSVGAATEISAVCTEPQLRGRGLAAALVVEQVRSIVAAGRTPFLHCMDSNTAAIALYRRLGFVARTPVDALLVSPPR